MQRHEELSMNLMARWTSPILHQYDHMSSFLSTTSWKWKRWSVLIFSSLRWTGVLILKHLTKMQVKFQRLLAVSAAAPFSHVYLLSGGLATLEFIGGPTDQRIITARKILSKNIQFSLQFITDLTNSDSPATAFVPAWNSSTISRWLVDCQPVTESPPRSVPSNSQLLRWSSISCEPAGMS